MSSNIIKQEHQVNYDSESFEVEQIIGRKQNKNTLLYEVLWKNYPLSQSTWEPLSNLKNSMGLVKQYQKTKRNSSMIRKKSLKRQQQKIGPRTVQKQKSKRGRPRKAYGCPIKQEIFHKAQILRQKIISNQKEIIQGRNDQKAEIKQQYIIQKIKNPGLVFKNTQQIQEKQKSQIKILILPYLLKYWDSMTIKKLKTPLNTIFAQFQKQENRKTSSNKIEDPLIQSMQQINVNNHLIEQQQMADAFSHLDFSHPSKGSGSQNMFQIDGQNIRNIPMEIAVLDLNTFFQQEQKTLLQFSFKDRTSKEQLKLKCKLSLQKLNLRDSLPFTITANFLTNEIDKTKIVRVFKVIWKGVKKYGMKSHWIVEIERRGWKTYYNAEFIQCNYKDLLVRYLQDSIIYFRN